MPVNQKTKISPKRDGLIFHVISMVRQNQVFGKFLASSELRALVSLFWC